MARAKVSSYFINIRPEEWKISEFYEYRQKEKDFPSSFQKETFILRRSLDYLMKDGSPEAKNYATLLDKNSRQVMFVAEGFKQRFRVLSMTRREVFVSSL